MEKNLLLTLGGITPPAPWSPYLFEKNTPLIIASAAGIPLKWAKKKSNLYACAFWKCVCFAKMKIAIDERSCCQTQATLSSTLTEQFLTISAARSKVDFVALRVFEYKENRSTIAVLYAVENPTVQLQKMPCSQMRTLAHAGAETRIFNTPETSPSRFCITNWLEWGGMLFVINTPTRTRSYPRDGGIVNLRFSPTHISRSPNSQPLMTCTSQVATLIPRYATSPKTHSCSKVLCSHPVMSKWSCKWSICTQENTYTKATPSSDNVHIKGWEYMRQWMSNLPRQPLRRANTRICSYNFNDATWASICGYIVSACVVTKSLGHGKAHN